jgi:hypothetical protein
MEQGWDPDVKKFLIKVLHALSYGVIWILASVTAGIYFHLAYADGHPVIFTVLFYTAMLAGLWFLLRYYYRIWIKR